MTYTAVLWKDWLVFRSKIISTTLAAIVGPLLYLIAFGWGIGESVKVAGQSYTAFVIPGIVAMNSMINSFNFIANDINISRIYGQTFEATMMSPIKSLSFTLAKVTAGALRGLYSAVLILVVSLLFEHNIGVSPYFLLVLVLNCCVFSLMGFMTGLLINAHADMAKVSSFVITPMSFLCGTFFPLDRFPTPLRMVFEVLPLTQVVNGLRGGAGAAGSWVVPAVLLGWLAVGLPIAVKICRRTE